jgi:D-lactate dehydrogenase
VNVAVFDTHQFDRECLQEALEAGTGGIKLRFLEMRLSDQTASLAAGCEAVCVFVNDSVSAAVLEKLAALEVRLVALRCAGFNNVDLAAARRLGIAVARVPEYSPHAIAEHAVALILALNRKLVRASARMREGNFLLDGLVGFDLYGKTVGIVGTGRIGAVFARIMHGFGCRLLGMDPKPDPELVRDVRVEYCGLKELLSKADIVSLHLPLMEASRHLLNTESLSWMKRGAILINTGRGALVDTPALIAGLKSGAIGGAGLDVYEEEEGVFFEDHSGEVLEDEHLAWLLMCPNVLVTAHQAFLTREALRELAAVTLANLMALSKGEIPSDASVDARRWLVGGG